MTKTKKMRLTVTVTVHKRDVDLTIKDVLLNIDLFRTNYCGYWAHGAGYDKKLGWLVFDQEDKDRVPTEEERKYVKRLWKSGQPLPGGWFIWNRKRAVEAVKVGLGLWGSVSFESAWDANQIDAVVQTVLFGEVRYV